MATQWTAGTTAGQVLTAATLNTIGAAYETWTPALTAATVNPTLGTGSTTVGRYGRINKTVYGDASFVFGTSGVAAGTGAYYISLPVTAQNATPPIGIGWILDASAGLLRHVVVQMDTTSRVALYLENTITFGVGAANPWTWAASDQIRINFQYEAA